MSLIWHLIVGGVIGWLAGMFMNREIPGGVMGNVIAGLIGSTVGGYLFPDMGPVIGGFVLVPALLGAIVLVAVVSFIFQQGED